MYLLYSSSFSHRSLFCLLFFVFCFSLCLCVGVCVFFYLWFVASVDSFYVSYSSSCYECNPFRSVGIVLLNCCIVGCLFIGYGLRICFFAWVSFICSLDSFVSYQVVVPVDVSSLLLCFIPIAVFSCRSHFGMLCY